jgi:hypothetical protein
VTLEKTNADRVLETGDLAAEGRSCHREPVSGTANLAFFGNGYESA